METQELPKRLSRREFLKGAAVAAATTAAATVIKSGSGLPEAVPEKEKPPLSEILFVDFLPEGELPDFIEPLKYPEPAGNFLSGEDSLSFYRTYLGEIIRARLTHPHLGRRERFGLILEEMANKFPRTTLYYFGSKVYLDHGLKVIQAANKVSRRLGGAELTHRVFPFQDILFTPGALNLGKDEWGNLELTTWIGGRKSAEILEPFLKAPFPPRVVNCSFQFGRVRLVLGKRYPELREPQLPQGLTLKDEKGKLWFFPNFGGIVGGGERKWYTPAGEAFLGTLVDKEGRVIEPLNEEEYRQQVEEAIRKATVVVEAKYSWIEIYGAYQGEEGIKSLGELISFCKRLPGVIVVASAGNLNDDLLPGRNYYKESWPENLVLVGEWDGKREVPYHNVRGADVYVDNDSLGLPHGSSFSAPVVSALLASGCSLKEILEKGRRVSFRDPLGRSLYEEAIVIGPQLLSPGP